MKIVFTNGCFDILHPGHIHLLKIAKSFGDYLIVGLNSDISIKTLKGNNRPINNEIHRKIVLKSIVYEDDVLIFNDTTPIELIKKVKPDILIVGNDYKIEEVIGNDIAETTIVIPRLPEYSTTKIIEALRGKHE